MTAFSDETWEIRLRHGFSADWTTKNPVLAKAEPGVELNTGKMKIGDGVTAWNDLGYFVTTTVIDQMIQDAIADIGGGGGDGGAALTAHINSLTPHPVYDDGPSLALLYENGKV